MEKPKVLLIEDDQPLRELLMRILDEKFIITAWPCHSNFEQEAVIDLTVKEYRYVIANVGANLKQRMDFVLALCRINPALKVIMMSGGCINADLPDKFQENFLCKPFLLDDLFALLEK